MAGKPPVHPDLARLYAAKLKGQRTATISHGSPRGPKGRVLNPVTDLQPKQKGKGRLQQFGKDVTDSRPRVS